MIGNSSKSVFAGTYERGHDHPGHTRKPTCWDDAGLYSFVAAGTCAYSYADYYGSERVCADNGLGGLPEVRVHEHHHQPPDAGAYSSYRDSVSPSRRDGRRTIIDYVGTRALNFMAVVARPYSLVAMIDLGPQQGREFSFVGVSSQRTLGISAGAGQASGGVFPDLVGTPLLMIVTSIIGVPLGLLSGIYLSRAGSTKPGRLPQATRFMVDVIAGTPSILAGVCRGGSVCFPS